MNALRAAFASQSSASPSRRVAQTRAAPAASTSCALRKYGIELAAADPAECAILGADVHAERDSAHPPVSAPRAVRGSAPSGRTAAACYRRRAPSPAGDCSVCPNNLPKLSDSAGSANLFGFELHPIRTTSFEGPIWVILGACSGVPQYGRGRHGELPWML